MAERNYKEEYKKFHASAGAIAKRAKLNKINRDKGTYGNGDNKDWSHQKDGGVILEDSSVNKGHKDNSPGDRRARGGKGDMFAKKGGKVKLKKKKRRKKRKSTRGKKSPAWQRKEGKNPSGGLNKKGVASYRRANPGSKLKTAVTTKPSKLKKGSKAAKRRKSFCARMKGMKRRLTSAKTARDPNSRINKSLRKWNCKHGCTVILRKKPKD